MRTPPTRTPTLPEHYSTWFSVVPYGSECPSGMPGLVRQLWHLLVSPYGEFFTGFYGVLEALSLKIEFLRDFYGGTFDPHFPIP